MRMRLRRSEAASRRLYGDAGSAAVIAGSSVRCGAFSFRCMFLILRRSVPRAAQIVSLDGETMGTSWSRQGRDGDGARHPSASSRTPWLL